MPRTPLPARLLRRRLVSLLEALPDATSGDVVSVHRARVASRRLRAVLPVLADAAGAEDMSRAGRQVRRITQALGPIREIDVALGHLDDVGTRAGVAPAALGHVRRALEAERRRHRVAMLDVITPSALALLEAGLQPRPVGPRAPGGHEAELRSARRRAARRAARLVREIREAGSLYVPERLHAVRIAAKKLRYALEIERDLMGSRAAARVRVLKRLQDDLGEVHDYEVLLDRTRDVQAALAGTDRATAQALDPLVRALEHACRSGHAAYLGQRSTILSECRAIGLAARAGRPTYLSHS